MHILLLLLLVPFVLAMVFALAGRSRAAGWTLAVYGACLLLHAGGSIALIVAHNGEVPAYVNYWFLFATIPAGALLLLAGAALLFASACADRKTAGGG